MFTQVGRRGCCGQHRVGGPGYAAALSVPAPVSRLDPGRPEVSRPLRRVAEELAGRPAATSF